MRNMIRAVLLGFIIALGAVVSPLMPLMAAEPARITTRDWTFDGPFGYFDKGALQRGLQVYREVCAACHGLDYISFRNFAALGYSEDEIRAMAAEYEVQDGPDAEGEFFTRAAVPADRIPDPFANENAARAANGGAYPPDLSLMIKARADGANYVYSLLTGYSEAPESIGTLPDGMYFNEAYSGNMIAMAQPIHNADIEYADGSDNSIEAVAADVVAFLAWTAEPEMEQRKRMGLAVLVFLFVMCFVSYGAKRYVWADVKK